ncbi:MAG: M23 family metallopeptidase [Candidatus Eremiobacteraeota bacterium]|nr:M23 family metallopeptidase [Candidatus Eremiobacteraeota bacterium]
MDIQTEIAAVQSRIQEISQGPGQNAAPAPGGSDAFSAMVARALSPQAAANAFSVAAPTAPLNEALLAQGIQPSAPLSATPPTSAGFVWPASGAVSSAFGPRQNPFGGAPDFHPGIDIAAEQGSPILAASSGRVIQAGPDGGYGNVVVIDHGNGVTSKYGHCSQTFATVGQQVRAGEEIAAVGSTGHSTGPHLHFEVRLGDKPVDPSTFLR